MRYVIRYAITASVIKFIPCHVKKCVCSKSYELCNLNDMLTSANDFPNFAALPTWLHCFTSSAT